MQEICFLQGRIAAIEQGKPDHSVVLFTHGYLDNANSFSEIIALMPDYYCVAIDLPGHGKSAHRSEDAHYHLSDYVYDLHSLIVEQEWENITLVGHSLGGIISTMLAACFPELVKQVISIESFGPLSEEENTSVSQLRNSILSRHKAAKPIKHPDSMDSIVEARMRVSDLSAEHALHILNRNTETRNNKLEWRTDKRLRTKSAFRLTPAQAINIIENVQCPYHLITGSKGFEKIKALKALRHNSIRDLHTAELPGGHHVHMENPEKIADYIKSCLKHVKNP